MRFLALFRTLSLASLGGVLLAQGSGTSPEAPRLTFEKYTLPNGLRVIQHVDRKLPMVHVNSWYHVGSKNERAERTEKYATPGKASLFLVGDASKIESGVKSLNIGEIVTFDPDGKPIEKP